MPDPVAPPRILETVRRFWGFDTLRPMQEEAIHAGLSHRDSLVVMPTGGGKSLCYQVPPVVAGRTDIVVSPLISLMKDQVDGLVSCGYPAGALHSAQTAAERRSVLAQIRAGETALLFVSPERLVTPMFMDLVAAMEVRAFAIDEAHCISHWGHDFRPEYRQLATLKDRFPGASVHAFTATATPRVQSDIVEQLRLENPDVLVGASDRPNLTYRIVPRVDVERQVVEAVRRHPREAVIVYCMTRRETESLAAVLQSNGVSASAYHAGLDASTRRKTQEAFARERLDVVVATVAFGMGIDRSNVRCVLHAAMPKSIEHYQQETGRAGRDGLEAECVLFYSAADVLRWKGLMERTAAEAEAPGPHDEYEDETTAPRRPGGDEATAAQMRLLEHMQGLCSTIQCRHRALATYFGEDYPGLPEAPDRCGACDVCLDEIEPMDGSTVVAQKIISCVARLGQRFGVGYVVNVLRGAETEAIRRSRHDQLSTYGILDTWSAKALTNLVYQLIDQDLLERSGGDRPIVSLTESSVEVLRGEREVRLLEPRTGRTVRKTKADADSWEGVDRGLFEALRGLRRQIAHERQVPPYVVFGDESLRGIARLRPVTLDTFRTVRGVGEKKLADLGPTFVEAVARYCDENDLEPAATEAPHAGGPDIETIAAPPASPASPAPPAPASPASASNLAE